MRRFVIVGLAVAMLAMPAGAAAQATEETDSAATIDWDQWGVPHITADRPERAFYALGWAQARGRPDLLLELMGQGRGRAAELWGEEYYQTDELMWRLGVPQALDVLYDAQGPDYQHQLDSFAAGINAYFAANTEAASEARRRVLPVTARDVIGHGQRALNLTFMAGQDLQGFQRQLAQEQAAMAQSTGDEHSGATPGTPPNAGDPPPPPTEPPAEDERGSNGWAIAPSRSESGNALLLINPHLPWSGLFTWFETHITTPEVNAYGAMLLGQPIFGVGFNERLGWTHTVNVHDGTDIYALTADEAGYRFGDETLPFDVGQITLQVRGDDGAMQNRTVTLLHSVHGPVIGRNGNTAFAVRIAGLADPAYARTVEQYWDMVAADNREEFEAAFSRLQMPMFNMVYADRDGEIAYVSNGLNPVRSRGDADFWSGMIDGSDPELLWTEYQPYERLMRVANPASGFVQNSNEPGWASTIPPALDPADFPGDYPPPTMQSRPLHGIAMLTGDESISYDELLGYARDPRLTLADYVLDDLIAAARADGRAELAEAADVLAAWDRTTNIESRGGVLFMLWASLVPAEAREFEREWRFADAATPPAGIADRDAAVVALADAAGQMRGGAGLDVAWGEAVRIPDPSTGQTVPVSLGPGGLGAFWVGYIVPTGERGISFSGGTSFVAAVEFDEQVRARALLPYGNFESRPEGIGNQIQLLSENRFREVNFTPDAIEQSRVMREVLPIPAE